MTTYPLTFFHPPCFGINEETFTSERVCNLELIIWEILRYFFYILLLNAITLIIERTILLAFRNSNFLLLLKPNDKINIYEFELLVELLFLQNVFLIIYEIKLNLK